MIRVAVNALAIVVSLGAAGLVPGPSAQSVRYPDDERLIINTNLDQLRKTPAAFKSVFVRFDIQFASLGELSNPFFTRFVPSHFANFHAWAGDQPIWRPESYKDVFGMLFVGKNNPVAHRIYELELYDRIRVVGVVQNTFQDAPWIEVVEFEQLPRSVDTATLAHMYRGERFMNRREWRKAIAELQLAPSDGMPTFLRAEVHRDLGICHLRLGEADQARGHLQMSASMQKPDVELRQLVSQAEADPRALLDHAIDRDSVPEADRPLWEAFEELDDAGDPAVPSR